MTPVVWSPPAIRDVFNPSRNLAESFGGSDVTIREIVTGPYRIVYRLRGGIAEVATVFRGSRKFPELP